MSGDSGPEGGDGAGSAAPPSVDKGALDSRLRAFIHSSIGSVEHLEVLLLLLTPPGARTATRESMSGDPRWWTASEVTSELRGDFTSIDQRLRDHVAAGLVEVLSEGSTPLYRFNPADSEMRELSYLLAVAYRERRYRVIDAIFSRPIDRLRIFANAFKYRGDK